jgi:hypothetical protein
MNALMPARQDIREPNPFVGVLPHETIGIYLEKPLKDYSQVFKEVPQRHIQATEEKIERFFAVTPQEFYARLPVEKKQEFLSKNRVRILALGFNATEMFKIVTHYIIVSTTISFAINGAVVVFTLKKPVNLKNLLTFGVAKQILCGQVIGTAVGTYFGVKAVRRLELEVMGIVIAETTFYTDWKEGKYKELHDLYLNAFKNYCKGQLIKDEFDCIFTTDVPLVPVRTPGGQVYEKSEIETQLDIKYAIIQRAIDSGSSREYIEELQ